MKKVQSMQEKEKVDHKVQFESTGVSVCIVFGMPSRDCAYHGICRIEPEEANRNKTNPGMSFAKIFWDQNTQLNFAFSKASIQLETLKKNFGSGYFIVIESYHIPEFVCRALGVEKLVVEPGLYPIHESDDTIYTQIGVLNLSNQNT